MRSQSKPEIAVDHEEVCHAELSPLVVDLRAGRRCDGSADTGARTPCAAISGRWWVCRLTAYSDRTPARLSPKPLWNYCLVAMFAVGIGGGFVGLQRSATDSTVPVDAPTVFLRDCAVCHGADASGTSRGPTLQGVGSADVDYQLTTGRMPLNSSTARSRRQTPKYDAATITALVAYAATLAPGGPGIPDVALVGADVAAGGTLYRAQCAACHQWAGDGGALRFGNAPSLTSATPTQIAEAIRVGPSTMPVFGHLAFSATQLNDVVAYVHDLRNPDDAGGQSLWHLGPLAEGAAALIGLAVLIALLRLVGTRT